MGYNYTKEFLARRPQDVAMVRAVYRDRRPHYMVLDYHTEVVTARHNINNVIRALAMFYPDEFVDVSKKVRTKTDQREDGKWTLTVYAPAPGEVLVGRPSGRSTASTWIGSAYTPPMQGVTNGEYQHDELIIDQESWTRFMGRIIEMPQEIKLASVEFETEILNLEPLTMMAEHNGWTARLNGPTTLLLERP